MAKPKKWTVDQYCNFLTHRIAARKEKIERLKKSIRKDAITKHQAKYSGLIKIYEEKLEELEKEFHKYHDPIENKLKKAAAQAKRQATLAAKKEAKELAARKKVEENELAKAEKDAHAEEIAIRKAELEAKIKALEES